MGQQDRHSATRGTVLTCLSSSLPPYCQGALALPRSLAQGISAVGTRTPQLHVNVLCACAHIGGCRQRAEWHLDPGRIDIFQCACDKHTTGTQVTVQALWA